MKIGILALQGAFLEHEKRLSQLDVPYFEIRQKRDLLSSFDGLILPGGESTVQGKLLHDLDIFSPLQEAIRDGLPVFGTCAGLLLLASKIENDTRVHLGTMGITAVRNAYGRQLGSFYTEMDFKGIGKIPMTFIRAPFISEVASDTEILAQVDNRIVAARQGKQFVTAFHPELSDTPVIHQYFLNKIIG